MDKFKLIVEVSPKGLDRTSFEITIEADSIGEAEFFVKRVLKNSLKLDIISVKKYKKYTYQR